MPKISDSLRGAPGVWRSVFRIMYLAAAGVAVVHAADGGNAVPHDWSHEYLIFSTPGDAATASQAQQDQRYWHQLYWRNAPAIAAAARTQKGMSTPGSDPSPTPLPDGALNEDWQENLGRGASAGANQFPAKFSFNSGTAYCGNATTPDYVAFNTGLAGSSSQATVVAYYNLYSGCTGAVPQIYWQYNTGGTAATSIALSLDGTQIAYVQNNPSGSASLVLLKWSKSPTLKTLTRVTHANYRACTAPCMTTIAMDSHTDTNSFPFYDFGHDQIYVGDDNGTLYKFDGVFIGTPAKDTTWASKTVSAGDKLTSPVYDSVTGYVFVGTSKGVFRSYKGTSGAAAGTSGTLGNSIADAPLVDSVGGKAYVFVGHDTRGDSGVYQFSTSFTSGSGTEQTLGPSTTGATLYHGTFDNIYYSSTNGTLPAGNLYVCGAESSFTGADAIFRFPILANVFKPQAGSVEVANSGRFLATPPACSPLTEFFNSPADWIFLSVPQSGTAKGCTGACVYSFNVASGSLPANPTAGVAESGGSSGIIIDNDAVTAGASQIYFTTLDNQTCKTSGGTGGCAVQASQSALK